MFSNSGHNEASYSHCDDDLLENHQKVTKCGCADLYKPVCSDKNVTFGNACHANCRLIIIAPRKHIISESINYVL